MPIDYNFDDTRESARKPFLLPGSYCLSIDKVFELRSRKGQDFFIAEFRVVKSTNPERPVGTQVAWMVSAMSDSFAQNVRSFLAATMQIPFNDVTPHEAREAVANDNPLGGATVLALAEEITTKAGLPFTRITWMAGGEAK